MPQPPNKNNGHKPQSEPPESLHFEHSVVKCNRCKRVFENFVIEIIDEIPQLRSGGVILTRAEMTCINCGWVFHWNIQNRDLQKMAVAYGQVLAKIGVYHPE